MKVLILIITFSNILNPIQATELNSNWHHIDLTINKSINLSCQKLTSNLTITRLFQHLFHQSPRIKTNNLSVDYKNLSGESHFLEFHILRPKNQMLFQISKGLFKGLSLTLAYKQELACEVKGNVKWSGEEKRFSKQLLNITIDHYLNRVMNFIERLT